MGKIVKFCSSCDEGFAEKFGFCPNCGATLQAFEMNPVAAEAAPVEQAAAVPATPAFIEPAPEPDIAAETVSETSLLELEPVADEPVIEEPVKEAVIEEPVVKTAAPKKAAKKTAAAAAAPVFFQGQPAYADTKKVSLEDEHNAYSSQGDYYITVIEEKNVNQRNGLLLGTLGFMIFAVFTGLVINIFSKDLDIGAIGDDIYLASLLDEVPMDIQEEMEKQNKDKGGGGGGGREEQEETTQGDLADQTEKPVRPPDAKIPRMDSELQLPTPSTEGNQTFEKKYDRWGDPNGRFASFSNGTGSGGGQGSGFGTGQGSGRGTGTGSGIGSGNGGGRGNGNGNGDGDGDGDGPPPKVSGVTQALQIISKPRPGYTDAARQNNVQGTVILRVTFQANGQIGAISSVKGLPYGLTEQAIAAARRISFSPKKIDGVGQSVTRQIEYTFSIY